MLGVSTRLVVSVAAALSAGIATALTGVTSAGATAQEVQPAQVRAAEPSVALAAASAAATAAPLATTVDVTGDGFADLVLRDTIGKLYYYVHNGQTGTAAGWPTRVEAPGGGWNIATAMMLGDVTGDGKPDIVIRETSSLLYVYVHNGQTGSAANWTTRYSAGGGWNGGTAMMLRDVTGDGKPDIVLRDTIGKLFVYLHNGQSGTAANWTTRVEAPGGGWNIATTMMLDDVTGDGFADIVTRETSSLLYVYVHNGQSGSAANWTTRFAAGGGGWNGGTAMLLRDVTGDGKPDIVLRDTSSKLFFYPHNGQTGTAANWVSRQEVPGGGWNIGTAMVI